MWYTDGSNTAEGFGNDIYLPRTKYYKLMGNLPNIFQAKAYAIGRRAQFNIDKNYQNRLIAFLSVSQAGILTLRSGTINSKTV